MRLRAALSVGLALALARGAAAQNNVVNETAFSQLSPCVVDCSAQSLSKYACLPTDSCFCDNDSLTEDLASCLASCPFSDQLAATKFQMSTCNRTVGNLGPLDPLFFTSYALATLFTAARILSRLRKFGGAGFGWDDATAVLSCIPLTAFTICAHSAVQAGGGTDIWGLSERNVQDFAFSFYLCTVFYTPVVFMTKMSLVLLYARVWSFDSSFRNACWATLLLLIVTLVPLQTVVIMQCRPVDFLWTRLTDPGMVGTCIDREAWLWSVSIIAICLDLVVLLLPVPKLSILDVSTSRKLGLCAVFFVGFVVTALSFVRLKYVRGFTTTTNPTRYYGYLGIYSDLETQLSQICCCMPTIPGLVRRTHHFFSSKHSSTIPPESKPFSKADLEEQSVESAITKTIRVGTSASAFSAKSGAPAPVIHLKSNPFLDHSDALPRMPSIFLDDYRQSSPFHQRRDDRDEYKAAMPPPAISRK